MTFNSDENFWNIESHLKNCYYNLYKAIKEDSSVALKCIPFILNENKPVEHRELVSEACCSATTGYTLNTVIYSIIKKSNNSNILWEALNGYLFNYSKITPINKKLLRDRIGELRFSEDRNVRTLARKAYEKDS